MEIMAKKEKPLKTAKATKFMMLIMVGWRSFDMLHELMARLFIPAFPAFWITMAIDDCLFWSGRRRSGVKGHHQKKFPIRVFSWRRSHGSYPSLFFFSSLFFTFHFS